MDFYAKSLKNLIECRKNQKTELSLSGGFNQIPEEVYEFEWLEGLYVGGEEFTEVSTKIGKLKKLKSLSITNSAIFQLPHELSQLVELETLNLQNNNLLSFPRGLTSLTKLERIDISRNNIKTVPTEIERLSKLRSLNLEQNQLEQLPDGITNLANLRSLKLAGNKLNRLPKNLETLTNLIEIDLRKNNLSKLPKGLFMLLATSNVKEINFNDIFPGFSSYGCIQLSEEQEYEIPPKEVIKGGLKEIVDFYNKQKALFLSNEDQIIESKKPRKETLKQMIFENRIEEALRLISGDSNNDNKNEIVQLNSRYIKLNEKVRLGIISDADESIQRNKIIYSLITLIEKIYDS